MHKLLTGSGEYLSGVELRQKKVKEKNTNRILFIQHKDNASLHGWANDRPLIELGGRSDLAVKTGRENKRCWR